MKSLFNFTLIKEQLKRYWTLSALFFISYFLFILIPIWTSGVYAEEYFFEVIEMKHFLFVIFSVLVPFVTVATIFSYMYKQKAICAIHTMPFSKKELFFSNFIVGLIIMILPILCFCVILLLTRIKYFDMSSYTVEFFYGKQLVKGDILTTIPVVSSFFIRISICFIFYYCLFLLVSTLIGGQGFYLLLSIIIPLIPMWIYLIIELVLNFYLIGYSSSSFYENVFFEIQKYLFPVVTYFDYTYLDNPIIFNFVFIFIAALMFCGAFYLYHIRRHERTNDTIVFLPLKKAVVFFLSFNGMIFLGLFLYNLFDGILFLYIGLALGFFLSYYISQMLAEKAFNVFYKMKEIKQYCAVLGVIIVAIFLVATVDITGYIRHLPNISDVQGVYLQHPWKLNDDYVKDCIFIEDIEVIEKIIDVHEELLKNKKQLGHTSLKYNHYNYKTYFITYKLKNGNLMKREYKVPKGLQEKVGLDDLMGHKEVIVSEYYWLNHPELVDKLNLSNLKKIKTEYSPFYDEDGELELILNESVGDENIVIYDKLEIESLLKALKDDYVISVTMSSNTSSLEYIRVYPEQELSDQDELSYKGLFSKYSDSIDLYFFENTMQWLEENGYQEYFIEQ